jgi:bacterioferritin (cytochrome b1)
MNKPALIQKLNQAIALELCAVVQYNQYANVLTGPDRRLWHELFEEMSDGGLKDARKFGFHVVALGGTPTIEHAAVKQADGITEMLANAIELESALVQAYTEALEVGHEHPAYRNMLEDQIQHEHDEVEELKVYANKVERATASTTKRVNKTA